MHNVDGLWWMITMVNRHHTSWEAFGISLGGACTDDGDLVFLGVHTPQSWSIYTYSRVLGYRHSYDLRFPWSVSGVLSSLLLGSCVGFWPGPMRQGMRGSRPCRLESVRVVRCVWLRWENMWMRCVKTWWIIIKTWHTRIGKLQPQIGLCSTLVFHYQKAMQSIGWEPVASTNYTDNCLIGSELEYDYQGYGWKD
jgi:hypothetical protein